MSTSRRLLGTLALVTLLGAACSDDNDNNNKKSDALGSRCKAQGDERPAKTVLRCTESSVAFVETEVGSGTGVVIEQDDKHYVLTNEHVVDPFDSADVTLGDDSFDDLPVVGIDAAADIALLGPLAGSKLPRPLELTDGTGLERGDDVFLVGFPGESDADELETTIASGIVSRLRNVKEFDQSYIQTDASIGGGQSGGPLFDEAARFVGVAGLSFAEEFALVLSGRDVRTAVQRILDKKGDEYLSLPAGTRSGTGTTSGRVKLHDASDEQVLFLPAAGEDRTWHLTVDMAARPIVTVDTFADEEPLAISGNSPDVIREAARQLADLRGGRPDDLPDTSAFGEDPKIKQRETGPGRFTIPVKKDESAAVYIVAPLTDAAVEVAWQSDLALVPASRPVTEKVMKVGDSLDFTVGGLDTSIDVLVDLEAGQEVEAHVRSPQGDPGFMVFGPSHKLDHLTMADPESAGIETQDDTDHGLFGVDAKATFKAETAGTHRFRLYSNDYNTIRIRFSAVDCTKADCAEKDEKDTKKDG